MSADRGTPTDVARFCDLHVGALFAFVRGGDVYTKTGARTYAPADGLPHAIGRLTTAVVRAGDAVRERCAWLTRGRPYCSSAPMPGSPYCARHDAAADRVGT